jgi:hypothetical protein
LIFGRYKKLQAENQELKREVQRLKEENAKIVKDSNLSLEGESNTSYNSDCINAKEKADRVLQDALERYRIEINRLKTFVERWLKALPEPKERTAETRRRMALALALSEILKDNSCPETLEEGIEIINKLNDAIGGDNKNGGFNLDEVLNPTGELDLATLCKELGVMD